MRFIALLLCALSACEGDPIAILADATPDTTTADTRSDADAAATKTFPDGRICSGHDEDRDGFPDECDDCPNVHNPEQDLGGSVGTACRPFAPFSEVLRRLFFDPFTEFGVWQSFGGAGSPIALDADKDSLSGGTAFDDQIRFIASVPRAKGLAMVATAILTLREGGGRAGVLLRVSGDPKRFYACEINLTLSVFLVSAAPPSGCAGGPCKLETFDLAAGKAAQPIPSEIRRALGVPIGIRASVTEDGATVECRVFDPDPKSARTGLFAAEKYVMRVSVPPASSIAAGEVGLYTQGTRAQFTSLDVLTSP